MFKFRDKHTTQIKVIDMSVLPTYKAILKLNK